MDQLLELRVLLAGGTAPDGEHVLHRGVEQTFPQHALPHHPGGPKQNDPHGVQTWLARSRSGNRLSGSISTRMMRGSRATRTVTRRLPASHGSTGISTRCTVPSVRVTASNTGMGARPRSAIV